MRAARNLISLAMAGAFLTGGGLLTRPAPAFAQIQQLMVPGMSSLLQSANKKDLEVIRPIVNQSLNEDTPGTARNWTSPTGTKGTVTLLSGGAQAHSQTGQLRIEVISPRQGSQTFELRYQQDGKGEWRNIG